MSRDSYINIGLVLAAFMVVTVIGLIFNTKSQPIYNVGDCLYSVQNDMNGNPHPYKDITIKILERTEEDYVYTYVVLDGVRIEGNRINHEHSFVENTGLFVPGVCP